jgi:transposase-like protein
MSVYGGVAGFNHEPRKTPMTETDMTLIDLLQKHDGRCEIIGLCVGPSEAETFRTEFLRSLKGRGFDGVKL